VSPSYFRRALRLQRISILQGRAHGGSFAAGGSTDLLARSIAQRLNEAWKQPVVVDNRGGGGGIIGADHVAKSQADGYTVLVGTNTTNAVAASLYAKLPYDVQRDFAPITEIATIPQVLSVHPSIRRKR